MTTSRRGARPGPRRALALALALLPALARPETGSTPESPCSSASGSGQGSCTAAAVPGAPLPDADPLELHVRADRARVKLGEPFAYSVEIRHRPEERYLLRSEPALLPFRADGVGCQRDEGKGEARTTCTMRLALFALGAVDVPDLVFAVDRPADKARLVVPGPRITGVGILDPTVAPGSIPLRDPAPPAPVLVRTLRPLWWALGMLGAVALALLAVGAWRRLRARRAVVPELSPAERFQRRLAALEAEQLARRGRGEEHLTRLSGAVRELLGALTGLPVLDRTSEELLGALARAPDPRVDAEGLARFLVRVDQVKFAGQPADPALCAAGLEFARALLERCRQAEGS